MFGDWYEYHLTEFTGTVALNKDAANGTPNIIKGYLGVGTGIIKVRQGIMIPSGQLLSTDNPHFLFDPPYTAWYAVFIFDITQHWTLFTYSSTMTNNTYLMNDSK